MSEQTGAFLPVPATNEGDKVTIYVERGHGRSVTLSGPWPDTYIERDDAEALARNIAQIVGVSLYEPCGWCGGDGVEFAYAAEGNAPGSYVGCDECDGKGFRPWGSQDDEPT